MEPDEDKVEEKEDTITVDEHAHIDHSRLTRRQKTTFDRSHAREARTEEDKTFWLHED